MFGDDVLLFNVVEVPVPRRNGFHTRTKNQNSSILVLSQIVRHRRRRFCHEFELLSRDAPSSKFIMIFMQHLDSTGTVHTAQHTQGQFSGHHVPGWHRCRTRVSRRKSQKILPPPFTGVGTLSHSSTCRCLFTPREYYIREKLQLSNHQYDALIGDGRAGEEAPSFEGGVHVRTCRCTPHLTCVSLSSNGSLATHQVWTQSAQPFARYGRGVCTCARADVLYLRHVESSYLMGP